eukprot:s126_g19.t1
MQPLFQAVLLREWLRGLQISVPNFEISRALSKLGVALNVTGGRCRGLELEEFQLVDGSADPQQMAFTFQLDLGINCLVNTTLQAIGPAKTCELEVETAAAVARVGLQVPVEHGLPGEVSATCALQPDLTKLHVLTRSLACGPLRLVERGLQEFINDLAPTLLCAKVSSYLTEWLSKASKELRDFVSPFLKPADVLPIPAAAKEALDLREVFWKGPMGHVLRSFLQEVIHVENATRLDQVLGFLQQDLGLRSWLPQRSWEAHVPWIQDMFLSLWMQNASVNLTNVEELHFQFSGPAAARLAGVPDSWRYSIPLKLVCVKQLVICIMFKNTYQSGFLSILYSIGSKPLQIWDKKVRNGHIKRLTDSDIQSSVLEIMGTNVSTTFITCPADPSKTLGIKLPFLVMIIKNLKKYFTFEVTVLDDKEVRRRFRASNYQSTTRVKPFICTMPMRLDEGWNQGVESTNQKT